MIAFISSQPLRGDAVMGSAAIGFYPTFRVNRAINILCFLFRAATGEKPHKRHHDQHIFSFYQVIGPAFGSVGGCKRRNNSTPTACGKVGISSNVSCGGGARRKMLIAARGAASFSLSLARTSCLFILAH
jgi:hypothetical protein